MSDMRPFVGMFPANLFSRALSLVPGAFSTVSCCFLLGIALLAWSPGFLTNAAAAGADNADVRSSAELPDTVSNFTQPANAVLSSTVMSDWLDDRVQSLEQSSEPAALDAQTHQFSLIAGLTVLKAEGRANRHHNLRRLHKEKSREIAGRRARLVDISTQIMPHAEWISTNMQELAIQLRQLQAHNRQGAAESAQLRRMSAVLNGRVAMFRALQKQLSIEKQAQASDKTELATVELALTSVRHPDHAPDLAANARYQQAMFGATSAQLRRASARRDVQQHKLTLDYAGHLASADIRGDMNSAVSLASLSLNKPRIQPDGMAASILTVAASASLESAVKKPLIWQSAVLTSDGAAFNMAPTAKHFGVAWSTMPVAGDIEGDKRGNTGLLIAGKVEQPVVAPGGGQIIFADRFKKFGRLLIIDHGGDYHTLIAGLQRIEVGLGDSIVAGQLIGLTAGTGSEARPLYVELRHDGRPVSPVSWLAQRQLKKVQG